MKLNDKQIGNLDAKQIHIINLIARNARLKAALGACLDCLKQVEWVELVGRIDEVCPWCNNPSIKGHKEGCLREITIKYAEDEYNDGYQYKIE